MKITHSRAGMWRNWNLEIDHPVTSEEAATLQQQASYHPAGYGFYDFKQLQVKDGVYYYSWKCASSCD